MAQVGFLGERLDLLVRQGTSLGPFVVTLSNPDTSPMDLTNCIIRGQVRKNAIDVGAPVATFTINYLNRINGQFSFEIPHNETEAMPAGEFQKDPESQYQWDMEMQDSLGKVIPLYYGTLENYRGVTK